MKLKIGWERGARRQKERKEKERGKGGRKRQGKREEREKERGREALLFDSTKLAASSLKGGGKNYAQMGAWKPPDDRNLRTRYALCLRLNSPAWALSLHMHFLADKLTQSNLRIKNVCQLEVAVYMQIFLNMCFYKQERLFFSYHFLTFLFLINLFVIYHFIISH